MADEDRGIEFVADAIRELGYKARVHEDGLIESGTAGLKFSLTCPGMISLQFHCGLILAKPEEFDLKRVNDFNARYRFAKVYLDNDGDVCCEADFPIGLNRDTFPAELQNIFGLWDGSMGLLKEKMAEGRRDARAEATSEELNAAR